VSGAAKPSIGFLGLGEMGRPMAARLLAAGYEVTVWNRSPGPEKDLVGSGAKTAANAAEVFGRDIAITMLANDAATREVVGGALAAGARPRIHANMATISVALAAELESSHAAAGVDYVASPVFGRPEAAQAGQLNIIAAGNPDAVAELDPVFRAMGKAVWPVGADAPAANAVKIGGNLMLACAIEAMGEGAGIAEGHGVPASRFLEIMTETLFGAIAYRGYGAMIGSRTFEPAAFKLPLGLKDVNLAMEAAEGVGKELPFGAALRARFESAIAAGLSDKDWSAIGGLAVEGKPVKG
jgi:3-hydroxyisobutyrate dehydrogenase-like beta-hydroxyacid dehydrogenase